MSYHEILHNSILHSMTRSSHILRTKLASSPRTIQSPLTAVTREYLMKIYVGMPSLEFLAVADTGSHLTWTQCKPCIKCYNQDSSLFNPGKFSTYKNNCAYQNLVNLCSHLLVMMKTSAIIWLTMQMDH